MGRPTSSREAETESEVDQIAASAATLREPPLSFDAADLALTLLQREWSRLALVAPESSPKTWGVATSLARACKQVGRTAMAINALQLDGAWASGIAHFIGRPAGPTTNRVSRFVLAVDSPVDNPLAMNLLSACDAVVVVLELEKTELARARNTIEFLGRDRLLGVVLIGR